MALQSYLNELVFSILVISLLLSGVFSFVDYRKKRKVKKEVFISFIIPTYNDSESINETIASIYSSYNKNKMEIIIINDNSTDNTLEVLKELKKRYKFLLINNKRNLGKAASVNKAFNKTSGDIVIVSDSDMLVNAKAVEDILARFEEDSDVGGVSCRYKARNNKKFLGKMQDIEYNMLSFVQSAYNPFSTIALWGGFMGFRRKAFKDIGGLSSYCLTEDLDAALKLNEKGWKVKQSYFPVYTYVPENLKTLYKQKLRWGGGFMQGFVDHWRVHIKNPISIFFMVSYALLSFAFVFNLVHSAEVLNQIYISTRNLPGNSKVVSDFISFLGTYKSSIAYMAFTIPYIIFDKDDRKKLSSYLLLIPYALIYFPIYSIVNTIGFMMAIFTYKKYKAKKRAW
ncbi:glycosyltransferase [Candidatus Pacearchaeota archaeon]|nr:glycosyltransferase [Candidatus Pacearchaeota archaeon]